MVGDDGDSGDIHVASMVESIVGCKWSLSLLRLAADGTSRPSALLRACPGLSAKVMNERLQKMQRFGIDSIRLVAEGVYGWLEQKGMVGG